MADIGQFAWKPWVTILGKPGFPPEKTGGCNTKGGGKFWEKPVWGKLWGRGLPHFWGTLILELYPPSFKRFRVWSWV